MSSSASGPAGTFLSPDRPRPAPPARPPSSPSRPVGLVLSPFRALRFDTERAGDLAQLTSPPYDVIDADEQQELERASAHNIVRLILPRPDPEADQAETDRYGRAAAALTAWREQGVLVPDEQAALYVYEQSDPAAGGHVQRGLVGALALTPPEDEIVLPHENTMAGPVSDRLALYTAVEADLEPIFCVYDGGGAAARTVEAAGTDAGAPPGSEPAVLLVDTMLGDGLRHRVWAVTDPAELDAVAQDLLPRKALIADGHHRYATYLRRQELAHRAGRGAGPWDEGLCLLVDATSFGPQVHPIHRVVPGRSPVELANLAAGAFAVRRLDGDPEGGIDGAVAELARAGADGPAFLLAGGATTGADLLLLTRPEPDQLAAAVPSGHSPAWSELDVSVLSALLIRQLWGIEDEVAAVGYAHDVRSTLTAAARSAGTAVLLNPTPVEAVAAVAAAGDRMPRKSTLFTPKPRTGVLVRDHRDG